MTDSLPDPNGAAADHLRTLVADYGPRVLDDRAALANLLPDLFADLPRERRIVEAAAGAGVGGRLTTLTGQGTPLPTAVATVSRTLSDEFSLTPGAAEWVVSTYARALGLEPAGLTPPATPVAAPTPGLTVMDNPWAQPVPSVPPYQPYQPVPSGPPYQPGQVSGPPGWPTTGYPQPWSVPPAPPKPRRTWLVVLLIAVPVLALLAGTGAFFAVKVFNRANADCVVGTWRLSSETIDYTNPASTTTYTGNGSMTVTFNSDGTGSMVTDHLEFDLGGGSSYTQTGNVTYRWTRTGDRIDYTDAAGQVTTVIKISGQPEKSETHDGGPLTSDTVTCRSNALTATGGGESTNDDGSKGTYTYRQEFNRR
ncbi:lipocalin family protein [Luedemannella flava]|uniref:lipocalin family protein n=1 Tax=Luedemannella flava TaxID=349316 RepID=UPI0031D9DBBE